MTNNLKSRSKRKNANISYDVIKSILTTSLHLPILTSAIDIYYNFYEDILQNR